MAKNRTVVPSVEDIRARMQAQAAGQVPDSIEVIALKKQVELLQGQVAVMSDAKKLNPAELRLGLDNILKKYGVEPAEEVVKLLMPNENGEYQLTPKERTAYWLELMQYRMPKLRAMEHSGKVDQELTLVVMKFSTGEEVIRKPLKFEKDNSIEVEVTKS
jgi:hypothetical protein